jgi:hypothetical protein
MGKPIRAPGAIAALAACCIATSSIAAEGTFGDASVVGQFDKAVALGLPATIHLPRDCEHEACDADTEALTLLSRLDVDIRMPNGDTVEMFDARVDGARAVVARRAEHVDVTLARDDGLDTRGFTFGSDEVEHVVRPSTGPVEYSGQPDAFAQGSSDAGTMLIVSPERGKDKDPLRITIFVHDDTGITDGHDMYRDYLSWWLAEMKEKIVPRLAIQVNIVGRLPGVTDIKYGGTESLTAWTAVVNDLVEKRGYRRTHKDKYLLFTARDIAPGLSGVALRNRNEAIASKSGGYTIVAHELGHTLGARHEDAEVQYGGWWCETNMYGTRSALRSNCYTYSERNRARIRDYVAHGVL